MILFQKGDWAAEKVIAVPPKKVEGWALPHMPGIYFECVIAFFTKEIHRQIMVVTVLIKIKTRLSISKHLLLSSNDHFANTHKSPFLTVYNVDFSNSTAYQ